MLFNKTINSFTLEVVLATVFMAVVFVSLFFKQPARNKLQLCGYIAILAVILLCPVKTSIDTTAINLQLYTFTKYNAIHFLENTILFVPLGFLLFRATKKPLVSVALVFIVSFLVELLQIKISGRVCDINDIFANLLGGTLGVLFAVVFKVVLNVDNRCAFVSASACQIR